MSLAKKLERIDDYRWRIPRDERAGMRTDVLVFATRAILNRVAEDQSLQQAVNVAGLPGIVGPSLAMPDIHQGYGFPIGGVAATSVEDGVVSPGGVGFDINCGVRLMRVNLERQEVAPRIRELVNQIFRDVPCGTGGSGTVRINDQELEDILVQGAPWMVAHGYGLPEDAAFAEAGGALPGADPEKVSYRARQRGRPQIGTLGSGNHFLEIQYVERIADEAAARAFGLRTNQIVVLIHSGSRGLGHQVCTDYLQEMDAGMKKYGIELPDRQLACVPVGSREGQAYLAAMRAAANFAWANRQGIMHFVRLAFQKLFGGGTECSLVYDVCHNIAKQERHRVRGRERDVLVHRKGATRAFPPGHAEVTPAYRSAGQPVFIPGSMGTASWVLAGQAGSMEETFGTTCHGAGRLLSRKAAQRSTTLEQVLEDLARAEIVVKSETKGGFWRRFRQRTKTWMK